MLKMRFFFWVLLQVILITATCFIFTYLIPRLKEEYLFSLIGLGIIILLQVVLLVYYVTRVLRDLSSFFSSIQNEDSSLVFSGRKDDPIYRNLHHYLNELNSIISGIRIEKAKQNLYLNNIVEHISIGLISYNKNGIVEIFNSAAKKLLNVQALSKISDLDKYQPVLFQTIKSLRPNTPKLIKIQMNNEILQLSLNQNIFKISGQTIKIVSIQNIVNELQNNELDSWQKLIRVLTHEIMNSVSPITSLISSLKRYFKKKNEDVMLSPGELKPDVIEKVIDGLNTIEDTGEGLLSFVENYRNLTNLPALKPRQIRINRLFKNVILLMNAVSNSDYIKIETKIDPENLEILADVKQLEQVLINLIQNSVQAIKRKSGGVIKLNADKSENESVNIEVIDNGSGIPEDIIEDIFIPFYTTREGGSGIGLSLSRQIIKQHGGSLSVKSAPGKGAKFTIII